MAADFMPVEDMGRRQRTRDAEAAAERENKVPPRCCRVTSRVKNRCDVAIIRSASVASCCPCLRIDAGDHAPRSCSVKSCR